jgi:OOP family OmpA-OmpF porin
MKATLYKLSLALAASAVMVGATAYAQLPPDQFVQDPFGNAVVDPFGDCVRSISGQNLPACGAPLVTVAAEPPPTPVRETITLGTDTFFDFDKATLKPAGKEALNDLADKIRGRGAEVNSIEVVGNTDSIGTEEYNQGLSERRAQAVVDFMIQEGVNPSLISAKGLGETNPIASNATAEGRAQNRRVEVTVEAVEEVMMP